MIKTKFYDDFLAYYDKARTLQMRNTGEIDTPNCGDPIMDNITIYDTVKRKYAGFSKALEDVHGVRCEKHYKRYEDHSNLLNIYEFHLVHLFHRFTGSGASFRPTFDKNGNRREDEHGYHNNHVEQLCKMAACWENHDDSFKAMIGYIVECQEPMVTSIGNQPPSLKNKKPDKYRLAMQYYFDNYAKDFVFDYIHFIADHLKQNHVAIGIKDAVDFCCKWHKDRGFKQWHFVLTAFVMDTAEYYPELVDPKSHCYYGANCVRAFKLMFKKETSDGKIKKADWNELCMTALVKARPFSRPYDMEDVCCDYIRYVVQYFPKGYEYLSIEESSNRSLLKVNGEYPDDVKKILTEVIGYYDYRTKAKYEQKTKEETNTKRDEGKAQETIEA